MAFCEDASQRTYARDGKAFEGFYLQGQFIFENQIINGSSGTRTHPGWVLQGDGYCQWAGTPPPRIPGLKQLPSTVETAPTVPTPDIPIQQNLAPNTGESGGAFLLVLALIGAAGYALWQQKNGKDDFADDYHPMADAPGLPPVATDEHLDHVYQRYQHPTNQGIDERNPWSMQQVYPHSQQPPPPSSAYPSSPVTPADTAVTGSDFVTSDAAATVSGDDARRLAREQFEAEILPAPKGGYFLGEESLLSKGQAYQIVATALELGYSKNWLCEYVFKIPKGGNGAKYKLLTELVNRVKGELGL